MSLEPVYVALLGVAVAGGVLVGLVAARLVADGRRRRASGSPAAPAAAGDTALDVADALEMGDWLSIGLLRIEADGRIGLANEAAHRYLGRRAGTLLGLTAIEGFVDHRIEDLAREAAGGEAQREIAFGGEPPVTLLIRARRASGGATWLILQDVSELRRLQRIRTEFIDNLSHELRTPLTTVRLLTELLASEGASAELSPRIREAISRIDVETGHLAQMVNELLDLARIEGGETRVQPVDVDLALVVDATVERLATYAERQGVALRAEVPATPAERTVRGDEERLGQALMNLAHNAVKFSPAGAEVLIRLRPEPAQVVLEIEDKGVGIPRGEQERIFERFYKVDRARGRGTGGTGLGLSIARHIVERHGGRVTVESAEGAGAVFSIALPRLTARRDRSVSPPPARGS